MSPTNPRPAAASRHRPDARPSYKEIRFHEGAWYKGQCDQNLAHGFGQYIGSKGGRYMGNWRCGRKHGEGVVTCSRGTVRYAGEWQEGLKEGRGDYTWPDGTRYSGVWRRGRMHGQGSLYYANGNLKYTGQWKNGRMHGQGEAFWPLGTRYNGTWEHGQMHGLGVIYCASGDVKCSGRWCHGAIVVPESDDENASSEDEESRRVLVSLKLVVGIAEFIGASFATCKWKFFASCKRRRTAERDEAERSK